MTKNSKKNHIVTTPWGFRPDKGNAKLILDVMETLHLPKTTAINRLVRLGGKHIWHDFHKRIAAKVAQNRVSKNGTTKTHATAP